MPKKTAVPKKPTARYYYVDEAGDGTLFASQGRVLVGSPGCSRFFILGLLDVPDPDGLTKNLNELRVQLLADPYFQGVPSMQPEARKTALAFHAKDDLPEVQREVMGILHDTRGLRFIAVVTDKRRVLDYVHQRNARELSYRYHPNELYDYLVRRLFKNLLHKDDAYHICFARRGKSDRNQALMNALHQARQRFAEQWGKASTASIDLKIGVPAQEGGLQAVDYFLWALQRLYEMGHDRYITYLWSAVRLVHDIDDTRLAPYGVYYDKKRPLTASSIAGRP